jgi:hypothetical protein
MGSFVPQDDILDVILNEMKWSEESPLREHKNLEVSRMGSFVPQDDNLCWDASPDKSGAGNSSG